MGTVVLSLDAEFAWGFHDLAVDRDRKIAAARQGWEDLIGWFDEFEIPATWALVGHLMLEKCDGVHQDHPAPADWFREDPGGTSSRTSVWFAPNLIRSIQTGTPDHEIACHSYSHVDFSSDRATDEVLDVEITRCQTLASEFDTELRSFVFPRNHVSKRSKLASHGFLCYRGNAPSRWYDTLPATGISKGISMTLGRSSPPIVYPEIDEHGLVNIPASLFLFDFDLPPKRFTRRVIGDPIARHVKRGVDELANSEGILHLWLHPNDLVTDEDRTRIRDILSYIATQRKQSHIDVKTMAEVANETLRPTSPEQPVG